MIYSTFQKRPGLSYLLLGLVFVIGVAEVALAGSGAFPDSYDWILGCLLFGTTLAWMCADALAGAVAPISNTAMKYAYRVFTVFMLIPVAIVIAYLALYGISGREPDGMSYFALPMVLFLLAWTPMVGLVGALAPRDIDTLRYVSLVIAPILAGIGVLELLLHAALPATGIPWLESIVTEYTYPMLFGSYGLATFLLFRGFLSRLKWPRWLRSGVLFVPVFAVTTALTTLTLWGVWTFYWVRDLWALTLFGVVILAPFGIVTIWTREFRVAMAALGIAMASYWVVGIVALAATAVLLDGSPFGFLILFPVLTGIVVSIPAGYLISRVRHPYRNVLVAAIGPGLLMMMIMCLYWFVFLGKAY